jgi:hypothetical protein
VTRRHLATVLALTLTAGCGTPPASTSGTPDAGVEALRIYAQGDCPAAAPRLREALVEAPRQLNLHYALAVCATHLDIRQEAITHFQWVLANAAAESAEATVAREWLTAVGVIRPEQEQPAAAIADAPVDRDVGRTTVRGEVAAAGGSIPRMRLFLKGRPKTPTGEFQYMALTGDDGRFEFRRIPAGTYMLSDTIVGTPEWRLRVDVPATGEVDLQLTAANRFPERDDFPEDGT